MPVDIINWEKISSFIYENWGVNNPPLYFVIFTFIGMAIGGWLFYGIANSSKENFESRLGKLTGQIILQDGSYPQNAVKIEVFKDNKSEKTYLAKQGKIDVDLPVGAYDFIISYPGYDSINVSDKIAQNTQPFNHTLKVKPKVIKLKIVDKSHAPYKGLDFRLKAASSNTFEEGIKLNFDANGVSITPLLEPSSYSLEFPRPKDGYIILDKPERMPEFLHLKTVYGKISQSNVFFLPVEKELFEIVFPKLIHTNSKIINQGQVKFPEGTKFAKIAQSITLEKETAFCIIGLTSFGFGGSIADTFQIAIKTDEIPPLRFLYETKNIYSGTLTQAYHGPISDYCEDHGKPMILEAGSYWLIHSFPKTDSVNAHELYGILKPGTKERLLVTYDNQNWVPLNSGFDELVYFFIE